MEAYQFWTMFGTLAGTIAGGIIWIHGEIKEFRQANTQQGARTDKLYEMFCDMQKEMKQSFCEMQKEIKDVYIHMSKERK